MRVTTLAATLGAADTLGFLATRPQLFRTSPQRARGSAALGAAWLALAWSSHRERRATVPLAAGLAAANAALLVAHRRAGVASPRIYAGAALSAAALGDSLRGARR